jgi:hypothetical protein
MPLESGIVNDATGGTALFVTRPLAGTVANFS